MLAGQYVFKLRSEGRAISSNCWGLGCDKQRVFICAVQNLGLGCIAARDIINDD